MTDFSLALWRSSIVTGMGAMGVFSPLALAGVGQVNARLNLHTGQPWVQVTEFELAVPTLPLVLTRHWVPQARQGEQACTWGEHWCLDADNRLLPQADGFVLADCCTGRPLVWQPAAHAHNTWLTPSAPGAKLTRHVELDPVTSNTLVLRHDIHWGAAVSGRIDTYSADGRLLQQSQLPGTAAEPVVLAYDWAPVVGAQANANKLWQLQAVRHSNGASVQLHYLPGGQLNALLHQGQTVRSYQYSRKGELLAAANEEESPAGRGAPGKPPASQYSYSMQGQLLAWPGGRVQPSASSTAKKTSAAELPRFTNWEHQGNRHQAMETVSGNNMTVAHSWRMAPKPRASTAPPSSGAAQPNLHELTYTRADANSAWQQVGLRAVCANGNRLNLRFDATTGRPHQLVRGSGPAPDEDAIAYSWGANGRLAEATWGSRRTRYLYNELGQWLGVRHQGSPAPNAAVLPRDLDFELDGTTGQIVNMVLQPQARPASQAHNPAQPGTATESQGLRITRDPANPARVLRTVSYGGVAPPDVLTALGAAQSMVPPSHAQAASDLSAVVCHN